MSSTHGLIALYLYRIGTSWIDTHALLQMRRCVFVDEQSLLINRDTVGAAMQLIYECLLLS